jgi:hypothetical protein
MHWLKNGEKNTRFFHECVKQRSVKILSPKSMMRKEGDVKPKKG